MVLHGDGCLWVWVSHGHECPVDVGAPGPGVPWHKCPHHEHPWPWLLGPFPQEHFNYYSLDPALGHLVFSLKYDEQEHLHLLLR